MRRVLGIVFVTGIVALVWRVWPEPHRDPQKSAPEEKQPGVVSGPVAAPPSTEPQPDLPATPPTISPSRHRGDIDPAAKGFVQTGDKLSDLKYGVTAILPEGWSLRGSLRWSLADTTLSFGDPDHPHAAPSVWYRHHDDDKTMSQHDLENTMYVLHEMKVESRQAALPDYEVRPDTVKIHEVNGIPAMSWTADYTRQGENWTEYITWLHAAHTSMLFFLNAPAAEADATLPGFEKLIQATTLP